MRTDRKSLGARPLCLKVMLSKRRERAAGRMPAGATRVLAAWVCHLRGLGAPVTDARADAVINAAL